MAEKIKIFELDIDVDGAISASKELKSESTQLKERLDNLKDAGKENSKEFVELEARYKSVRKEYNSSQRELGKMINLQGKNIKTIEQGRNALSLISREWAKQADLYGANSVQADKLAQKKTELTARLKEMEKQTGDNRRNVGNYTESMSEALGETTLFSQAQGVLTKVMSIAKPVYNAIRSDISGIRNNFKQATASTQGYTKAQKAAIITTNLGAAALKVFKLALASTGIGLIVVALGALVAWFSKTQKGIDLVNVVMATLSAGIDVIIDRFAALGGGIAKFLSGDFSGGIDDITSSFSGMGDEIAREIKLAGDLERVLQRVEKAEINLDIRRAAANSRLEELKLISDDVTKSTEERIKAAEEFIKIEQTLTAEQVSNQEKKVAAMLGFAEVTDEVREKIRQIGQEGVSLDEIGLSESTVEDAKEFRDEITKLFDLQQQSFSRQTENQNKLNALRNEEKKKIEEQAAAERKAAEERRAAARKATEEAIAESKTRLELFVEENKRKADSLEESVKLEEQVRDKRLAILEEELEAKKVSQVEFELQSLEIKNEFLDQQSQLTQEYAQKEIEAEKERLAQSQEREALEKERKATDLQNKMEIESENFEAQLEIEKQRLEMQRQQELAEAEKTGANKALINEKYAQIEKDVEAEKNQYKRDVAAKTFANLATILGKETAAGKAAAIAQTTIDTYSAATSAYKAMAGIPVVGPALGAIAAAAAVASGLQTVRQITATQEPEIPNAEAAPRAAKGITLKGPSHGGGGINLYDDNGKPVVNAEGDENIYVLNKRASGLINSLSYMNEATGGIPLSKSTTFAAAGGMIQRSPTVGSNQSMNFDYDLFAERTAQAVRQMPPPIVAVEDINSGQSNYAQVVNGANI